MPRSAASWRSSLAGWGLTGFRGRCKRSGEVDELDKGDELLRGGVGKISQVRRDGAEPAPPAGRRCNEAGPLSQSTSPPSAEDHGRRGVPRKAELTDRFDCKKLQLQRDSISSWYITPAHRNRRGIRLILAFD